MLMPESWSLRHKKPCSAPNTPANTPVSYLHNMNIKGLLFNIVRGERYLTSSSTFRREIPTMSAQLCQDLFNGFLLQRDNPAGKAWFSPLIFPQRGILRYRTNHTFPRSHDLFTGWHGMPCHLWSVNTEKGCFWYTGSLHYPRLVSLFWTTGFYGAFDKRIANIIATMPDFYEQDGKLANTVVYFHYFIVGKRLLHYRDRQKWRLKRSVRSDGSMFV